MADLPTKPILVIKDVTQAGTFGLALVDDAGRKKTAVKCMALATALAAAGMGADASSVRFPKGAAPQLDDGCTLSLSHSRPWLLAAAATSAGRRVWMGVDVERCKSRDFDRIGRFLGWPSPSRDALHFYRRWTLAEALVKALGRRAPTWFRALDGAAAGTTMESLDIDERRWRWHLRWRNVGREVGGEPAGVFCLAMGCER